MFEQRQSNQLVHLHPVLIINLQLREAFFALSLEVLRTRCAKIAKDTAVCVNKATEIADGDFRA